MRRTFRDSAIAATTIPAWLLSFAILICAADFNVAQAQEKSKTTRAVALACGKELKNQCNGVPVAANNIRLDCLQKSEKKLSARCAALANNVVRRCERDAAQRCQGVVAE